MGGGLDWPVLRIVYDAGATDDDPNTVLSGNLRQGTVLFKGK